MTENALRTVLVISLGLAIICYLSFARPDYLANYSTLAIFVGAELMLAALVKYRQAFFTVLLSVFLLAGMNIPMQPVFLQGRWIVLGVAAIAGVAIYIVEGHHRLGTFHLLAFFCLLSAIASASVSQYPEESRLKAASLVLLFLYAGAGARLALPSVNPQKFFHRLLLACEITVWVTAFLYLLLHIEIFGNPNSLGAVLGVIIVPMLLWGILTASADARRVRLSIEFTVAALLVMNSFARAGIGAAVVGCVFLCLSLRRYRLLVKGLAASVLLAVIAIMFLPHSANGPDIDASQSVESAFLYKGHVSSGLFGSRRTVWQQTWDSIQRNPWFGTGFGTSLTSDDLGRMRYAEHHFDSWVVREHGNSYFAIAEWTGLLGVLPFYALIALTAANIGRVFKWLRRTGDSSCLAAPAAAILGAGLFNALFEDWLFAVGYYLCVFFWAIAFIMVDVLPCASVIYAPDMFAPRPVRYAGAAASGQ